MNDNQRGKWLSINTVLTAMSTILIMIVAGITRETYLTVKDDHDKTTINSTKILELELKITAITIDLEKVKMDVVRMQRSP